MENPKFNSIFMRYSIATLMLLSFASEILAEDIALPSFNMTTFIKPGETIEFKGRDVTLISIGDNYANVFSVGGEKNIVPSAGGSIDGMIILVEDTFPDRLRIILNTSVNCGNEVCERNEDSRICCADCGCEDDKEVCMDKICAKAQCGTDYDCTDNNSCTKDTCSKQKQCEHSEIVDCGAKDGCCLTACTGDQDCSLDECNTSKGCALTNSCTTATCSGKPLKCNYTISEGCNSTDRCYGLDESAGSEYCTRGGWAEKRNITSKCNSSFECASGYCYSNMCLEKIGPSSYKGTAIFGVAVTVALIGFLIIKRRLSRHAQKPGF